MRLLIYAPAARMGGARAHLLGLVPELAAIASDDTVLLLAQPDLLADLPPLPRGWTVHAERAHARGFLQRLAWEQLRLPRIAERWRADVLLSFGSFVPLRSGCATVIEAGNALYFTRAYWDRLQAESVRMRAAEHARWALLRASLRAAERVLVPTRAMRHDVVMRLPDLAERVDVALWGVADVFHAALWRPPNDETILGLSKHGINKEFDLLIQALARLLPKRQNAQLVLTGTPEESRWSQNSAQLASSLGVAERVCWAGDVPNPRVPDLICQAQVLVFATWCESFGLPLAEGLAMGAPAVAADIPACREVGADAARFYTPGDADSLAREIDALMTDHTQVTSRARDRGRAFRWRDNAVGVHDTLQRAIRGRR